MQRVVISICGGTGSGKSWLARALVNRLGEQRAARIATDCYLKTNPCASLDEFLAQPFQYDWDLLEQTLQGADGQALTTPRYDFINFVRLSETDGLKFTLRPIMVLDAMVPYPKADCWIFLHTPVPERKRRIIDRDQRWGTQVINRWKQHQVTLRYVRNLKYRYDLQLLGTDTIDENVDKIMSILDQKGLLQPA